MEEKYIEFVSCDLAAIVQQLKNEGVTESAALHELKRISEDDHNIASCLALPFLKSSATHSVHFIDSEDVGAPLPKGKVIKITVEYAPKEEANP